MDNTVTVPGQLTVSDAQPGANGRADPPGIRDFFFTAFSRSRLSAETISMALAVLSPKQMAIPALGVDSAAR